MRTVRRLVPGFIQKHARFFLWSSSVAIALRLFLSLRLPAVVDDSRLYADIAKNWLDHGVYGITNSGVIMPTLSRLPGYPAFLAVIFAIVGVENFRTVLLVQVLFDLGTCWLVADMARRLLSDRAAGRKMENEPEPRDAGSRGCRDRVERARGGRRPRRQAVRPRRTPWFP